MSKPKRINWQTSKKNTKKSKIIEFCLWDDRFLTEIFHTRKERDERMDKYIVLNKALEKVLPDEITKEKFTKIKETLKGKKIFTCGDEKCFKKTQDYIKNNNLEEYMYLQSFLTFRNVHSRKLLKFEDFFTDEQNFNQAEPIFKNNFNETDSNNIEFNFNDVGILELPEKSTNSETYTDKDMEENSNQSNHKKRICDNFTMIGDQNKRLKTSLNFTSKNEIQKTQENQRLLEFNKNNQSTDEKSRLNEDSNRVMIKEDVFNSELETKSQNSSSCCLS